MVPCGVSKGLMKASQNDVKKIEPIFSLRPGSRRRGLNFIATGVEFFYPP